MPLLENRTKDDFIHTEVVYIDTGLDKADENQTNSNFTIETTNQLSEIISLEVMKHHIPAAYFSPFAHGRALEFKLTNATLGTETFTAWMGGETTPLHMSYPIKNVELARISQAIDYAILSSSTFSGYARVRVEQNPQGVLSFASEPLVSYGVVELEFLFQSGSNSASSSASALGFLSSQDYAGVTQSNNESLIVAPLTPLTSSDTYIDINIEQIRELSPLRRVYYPRDGIFSSEGTRRVRLLVEPPGDIAQLDFRIRSRTNGGSYKELPFDLPIFMELKVSFLDCALDVPFYTKKREFQI